MAVRIYFHYIGWEQFNNRFAGIDLAEADKQTETSDGIFTDVFWSGLYEYDDLSYTQSVYLLDAYERLSKGCRSMGHPLRSGWRGLFGRSSSSSTLHSASPDFEFCRVWLDDFDFAFRRLMPFWFNQPPFWRDSPIDFSPLETDCVIHTLSPQTVHNIVARFPTLDILNYSRLIKLIHEQDSPLDFSLFLSDVSDVAQKAAAENHGLCIMVL